MDATLEATVEFPQVRGGERWHVEILALATEDMDGQGAIGGDATGDVPAAVYIGDVHPSNLADTAPVGTSASAVYGDVGLVVPAGSRLTVHWQDGTDGGRCYARAQYRVETAASR